MFATTDYYSPFGSPPHAFSSPLALAMQPRAPMAFSPFSFSSMDPFTQHSYFSVPSAVVPASSSSSSSTQYAESSQTTPEGEVRRYKFHTNDNGAEKHVHVTATRKAGKAGYDVEVVKDGKSQTMKNVSEAKLQGTLTEMRNTCSKNRLCSAGASAGASKSKSASASASKSASSTSKSVKGRRNSSTIRSNVKNGRQKAMQIVKKALTAKASGSRAV